MPKRAALVSQFLENVSRRALAEHQRIIRNYVRRRYGVYALYRGDRLYYVGLASNLRGRLNSHLRDRHGESWDRFSVYLTIQDSHLRELESIILRVTRPIGNKQRGKFAKAENLRRRFSRDLREKQRRDLAELFGLGTTPLLAVAAKSRAKVRGRLPTLARYVSAPMRLRARFKGRLLRARVRQDGRIRFNGKLYRSPSLAAAAAVKRRTCNGWTFWKYERAPGDWQRLKVLRR